MIQILLSLFLATVVGTLSLSAPSAPFLDLTVISGDSVVTSFNSPFTDGGSAIYSYQVDWDTDPGSAEIQTITTSNYIGPNEIQTIATYAEDINEVQVVKTFATPIKEVQRITVTEATDGYFFLELDTTATGGSLQYSGYIEVNYPASGSRESVEDIINELSNVAPFGSVFVTRNTIDSSEYEYVVEFPLSMGNVPQMKVHTAQLTPFGSAGAEVSTVTDGNILGGTFRLTFEAKTTGDIDFDASEAEMREALEALATIGSVAVTRSNVDDQHGYEWTIEFTADMNDGDVSMLSADFSGLTVSSTDGIPGVNVTSVDGNELSGTFTLEYKGEITDAIPFDTSADDMKSFLEDLYTIPAGTISVSRTGPDGELAYTWTVQFLSDYNRTHEGDLLDFVPDTTNLNGANSGVDVVETRKGTLKEVQSITVTTAGADVNASSFMFLNFGDLNTSYIPLEPGNNTCVSAVTEVQTITTSTKDTTLSGGDSDVAQYLVFRLKYVDEVTNWISANPNANGDCSVAAVSIETQLENMTYFDDVFVTAVSTGISQGCVWTVDFISTIGDLQQLTVQSMNTVTGSTGSIGVFSNAGDDTVTTATITDGVKDAIKAQLELLDTIGTVTVTASDMSPAGECTWTVTFDTNAGEQPLLQAFTSESTHPDITVSTAQVQASTSEVLGGFYALSFRNKRTVYIPYDSSARQVESALEALDTIGDVTVERSLMDENGGFTWTVTFLTELGDVPDMVLDGLDLTGTVATGTVAVERVGVMPPFDSLDPANKIPLGSAVINDLTDLSLTVTDLEEGIAYYFRVRAINSVGPGDYAYADVPFAIPEPQRPGRPSNAMLEVIDGTSMEVSFSPPLLDGGDDVTFYRVEYGSNAFAQEIQAVSVLSNVSNEIQVVESSTASIPEVQLIYISTSYAGTDDTEVQFVRCDATGGSFRLEFAGYYSSTILSTASADDVKNALQDIKIINTVTVNFLNGITTACFEDANFPTGGFEVVFNDIVNLDGNLPMMKGYTNNLQGLRRIDITETTSGDAGIGGYFRLSFRGSVTEDIAGTSSASDVAAALSALDTIPTGGVTVELVSSASLSSVHDMQWRVTFSHVDLGGDVEDIRVENYFNRLTGSDVNIVVLTNGLESSSERGNAPEGSVRGNEITGTFTLTFRGHTTAPIDYNAAETVMKTRLEALPNIGTVTVKRFGPSVQNEYQWHVTFAAMPGSFPVGAGDVDMLIPDFTMLNGNSTNVDVSEFQAGSPLLDGRITLSYSNGTFSEVTDAIPVDASASEMEKYLNELNSIGTVSVSRTKKQNGYIWSITFDGCKIVDGVDVCAVGDVPELGINGINATADALSTEQILRGVGPDTCIGSSSGLCQDIITNLAGAPPYTYIMGGLTSGNDYYVRVFAHNLQGYGFSAVTSPEYATPTNNPPGAPPMVRLVTSKSTSIEVEWDYPRENGGATVMGFELWMDDWAGGNPRLVYDGTDNLATSFTVKASTSLGVEPGKSYRFLVRAVNYCKATDQTKACYGDFSEPAVFAVRSPRAPLAPAMPYRHSKSSIGSQSYGDSVISIRWATPLDNGGSEVTSYLLYTAAPGATSYTEVTLNEPIPIIDEASGDLVMEYNVSGLAEGDVYRFYVVAVNAIGRSASSPILSVVAGIVPGVDAFGINTYESVVPQMTSIEASEMSLAWSMPAYNSTGGTPITGYKVYMFPGVGLNTLANPNPVHKEIQMVTTSIDERVPEIQKITVTNATGGDFTVSLFGIPSDPLAHNVHQAQMALAIESVLSIAGYTANVSVTIETDGGSSTRAWIIDFGDFSTNVDLIVLDISNLENSNAAYAADPDHPVVADVVALQKLTNPVRGSFTLSYNGVMSIDMPYDVSAEEMKVCLEDLPGVWHVSVTREDNLINGEDRGAYQWVIVFNAAAGDLPMLYATPGRLTPLSSHVSITVTEEQAGSDALLVYDGTGIPDVRTATVSNLVPDMSYSFKVAPLNAIGDGVLSGASTTVISTSGSSAAYTTASGSALSIGITDDVDEQQIISAVGCEDMVFRLYWGADNMAVVWNNYTADEFRYVLENVLEVAPLTDVQRTDDVIGSESVTYWRITFFDMGDVQTIVPLSYSSNCNVSAAEFLKGNRNQFTIEPKKASGSVLREVATAEGFAGLDLFFTETYSNGQWYADQGIASYNPVIYEVVNVYFPAGNTDDVTLFLLDYLTPESTLEYETLPFAAASTAYTVQVALESLPNVDSVDVSKEIIVDAPGGTAFMITFVANLGDVPDMSTINGNILIQEVQKGLTEVQTITVAADEEFVREEQQITFRYSAMGEFQLNLYASVENTTFMSYNASAMDVQNALNALVGPNGAPVVTQVSRTDVISGASADSVAFTVRFISPVGDVPQLVVTPTDMSVEYTVVEAIKGLSPIAGTFTVFFEDEYTDDIDFDASAASVKDRLEDLSGVGRVQVTREDLGNGFKWTVTFTQNVGNLRMMEPSDYRYEIQRLWTEGGAPSPLYGNIVLTFGNDSVTIPYDADSTELDAALESMPSVGDVEVSRQVFSNGRFSWLITYRSLIGDAENIYASAEILLGSDASVYVEEVVAGNADTLTGSEPRLAAMEKIPGNPDFTGQYVVDTPGKYDLNIMQLQKGGLAASYYDNQWFYGQPSIERIDPIVNFDWNTGFLTHDSFDYVSIKWTGKINVDKSETVSFYLYADDGLVCTSTILW
jgi:hypothetical protein